MAKEEKAPRATKKEAKETPRFGINDLAELMGIEPASVRVKLRSKKVKKTGGRYGWNTKTELEEVSKQLTKVAKKVDKKARDEESLKEGTDD